MVENEPKEITLIFHSDKSEDKKMRAYVDTISTYEVKTLDLKVDSLTETQLAEIADKMNVAIVDLLDDSYLDSIANERGIQYVRAMSKTDILTLIVQNPTFLATPILIVGKKAYSYGSAFEILRACFNVDGVGTISSSNIEEKR